MNYNTFLERFGLEPSNFKNKECFVGKTENGFIYHLEQSDERVECPYCGRIKLYIKGYYNEAINVTINSNESDTLLIKRIRFKCRYCNKSFSPKIKGLMPYSNISNTIKSYICLDFFKKQTFKEIAARYDISESYVIKLFDDYFPYVPRRELSEIICIDEFHFSKVYDQNYCCVLCDFVDKKIIDVLKNRQKAYLEEYFKHFNSKELNTVKYYISDMYDEYRIIKHKFFPNAIHIVDLFHIILQATNAVDTIRVKTMKDSVERYSLEYNFMKKNWKCFLCKSSRIPNKTYTYKKTKERYSYYDLVYRCIKTNHNLLIAYGILQDLFSYSKYKDENNISNFIDFISNRLIHSGCIELEKVGRTYLKWKIEIINAFSREAREKKLTNATAEGMNNQIKTMLKSAYGYENFERFRKRLMLIYANKNDS